MKITSLQLNNFRCFTDFDIFFDKRLNVLVGINGSGKTAVLDALAYFLSSIADYISSKSLHLPQLKITDIPIGILEIDLQVRLKSDIKAEAKNFDYTFVKTIADTSWLSIQDNTSHLFNTLKKYCDEIVNSPSDNRRPVFVYYKSNRILPENNYIVDINLPVDFSTAYHKAFSREIDLKNSLAWFAAVDADEARKVRDEDPKYRIPELGAVAQAVANLLGDYESPRIRESELLVLKKGTREAHTLTKLSDGYRAMLAIIMDLARRMAVANQHVAWGENETALHSPAIVLIDEIELHMHPSWQQTVLPGLLEIFPNTQFFVTTNSPQVLTSIDSRHIRILQDGEAYTYEEPTEGAESSHLLERVLGVAPRPQNLELVRKLNEYVALVYSDKWDSKEISKLQAEMEAHFGRDDPTMLELDLHIKNSKWERGL